MLHWTTDMTTATKPFIPSRDPLHNCGGMNLITALPGTKVWVKHHPSLPKAAGSFVRYASNPDYCIVTVPELKKQLSLRRELVTFQGICDNLHV